MDVTRYNQMVQNWIDQVLDSRGRNARETLEYTAKILRFGEETKDRALMGFAHFYMGETYYMLNDVESFYKSAMQGLEYLQVSGQWELTAKACNLLGIVSGNQGNAPFALDYYLSGLAVCEKHQLPHIKSMIEYNIGTIYMCYGEYRRAISYLENSRRAFQSLPKDEIYDTYMSIVYISLASCYLGCKKMKETGRFLEQAREECSGYVDEMALMYLLCVEARYYNQLSDEGRRDVCIVQLSEKMTPNLTVMEVFDDFFVYCQMLLQIRRYRELWQMLEILDSVVKKSKLVYLQRMLLSIKIDYYKEVEDNSGYLQAAGLYYELSQIMRKEEIYVISSVMSIRFSLEEARRRQREVERENQLLQQKTERDALTGISNRHWLNRYAKEACAKACEKQAYFAVEILDVDYFKQYNDNYGHQLGDECLKAIAREMMDFTEREDIFCARYGGDEFILLYEGYGPELVVQLAKELRDRILNLNIEHKFSKTLPYVSISQGICCDVPDTQNMVEDFLQSADTMLYRVKNRGRNGISIGHCCDEISDCNTAETGTDLDGMDII